MAKSKKSKINPLGVHEALDRTFILSSMFSKLLVDHPTIKQIPKLKKKVDKLDEQLADLYMEVGQFK